MFFLYVIYVFDITAVVILHPAEVNITRVNGKQSQTQWSANDKCYHRMASRLCSGTIHASKDYNVLFIALAQSRGVSWLLLR